MKFVTFLGLHWIVFTDWNLSIFVKCKNEETLSSLLKETHISPKGLVKSINIL